MNTEQITEGLIIYDLPKWGENIRIKGILFDMDGVILDTEKLYTRFWQEAANALGYPMTKEQAMGLRSLNREFGAAKMQSYFDVPVNYEEVRNKRIELMNAFIEKEGVEPKIEPAYVDDPTVIFMVEHGMGISMLSELIMRGNRNNVISRALEPNAHRELVICMKSIKNAPPMVKEFVVCAKETIDEIYKSID